MTVDGELRRDVIMALMCQGRVEFEPTERTHRVRMADFFAPAHRAMREMDTSALETLHEGAIQVTVTGWFLVRAIAMVFDRHLQSAKERYRFSKVV